MMNRVLCLGALLALVGCVEGGKLPDSLNAGAGGSPIGMAGGGGAVAGGASDPLYSCPPPDGKSNAVLHADAAAVLSAMSGTTVTSDGMPATASCGFGSCHGKMGKEGNLDLGVPDLSMLRGQPSCEAPAVPIVAANGGDAALKNSWLWIKLVAPTTDTGLLIPDPAWGTGNVQACGDLMGSQFGSRMPFMRGAANSLDARRMGMIRRWICAGANPP